MRATWILIADAGRARVVEVENKTAPWEVVEEIDHPAGRARTSDLVGDQQGRVQQSGHGGGMKAGMEPGTDPADVQAERFARRLAGLLETGRNENRFSRLVLVAPPRFLGLLRNELPDPLAAEVVASVDKDYTAYDLRELRKRLGDEVWS